MKILIVFSLFCLSVFGANKDMDPFLYTKDCLQEMIDAVKAKAFDSEAVQDHDPHPRFRTVHYTMIKTEYPLYGASRRESQLEGVLFFRRGGAAPFTVRCPHSSKIVVDMFECKVVEQTTEVPSCSII